MSLAMNDVLQTGGQGARAAGMVSPLGRVCSPLTHLLPPRRQPSGSTAESLGACARRASAAPELARSVPTRRVSLLRSCWAGRGSTTPSAHVASLQHREKRPVASSPPPRDPTTPSPGDRWRSLTQTSVRQKANQRPPGRPWASLQEAPPMEALSLPSHSPACARRRRGGAPHVSALGPRPERLRWPGHRTAGPVATPPNTPSAACRGSPRGPQDSPQTHAHAGPDLPGPAQGWSGPQPELANEALLARSHPHSPRVALGTLHATRATEAGPRLLQDGAATWVTAARLHRTRVLGGAHGALNKTEPGKTRSLPSLSSVPRRCPAWGHPDDPSQSPVPPNGAGLPPSSCPDGCLLRPRRAHSRLPGGGQEQRSKSPRGTNPR